MLLLMQILRFSEYSPIEAHPELHIVKVSMLTLWL